MNHVVLGFRAFCRSDMSTSLSTPQWPKSGCECFCTYFNAISRCEVYFRPSALLLVNLTIVFCPFLTCFNCPPVQFLPFCSVLSCPCPALSCSAFILSCFNTYFQLRPVLPSTFLLCPVLVCPDLSCSPLSSTSLSYPVNLSSGVLCHVMSCLVLSCSL